MFLLLYGKKLFDYKITEQLKNKNLMLNKIREEEKFKKSYNDFFKKNYICKPCLCGSKRNKLLFKFDRYNLNTRVVLCKNCGLVYANRILPKKDLTEFYASDSYRFFYNVLDNGVLKFKDDYFLDEQIENLESTIHPLSIIEDFYTFNSNEIILELGSGFAQVSRSLKRKGKLICVDYSDKAVNYLQEKRVEAYRGGTEVLEKLNLKYDLIILSHVVEHFYDFKKDLINIIKYLNDEGKIYIEVPNLDSKYNLEQFQNAHNYYFTKNTLLFYVTSLGLSPDYICEKVNKLHLGVIFSKKNNEIINYNLNNEINKIQNYHKKYLSFKNLILKKSIEINEMIKVLIGLNLTILIREIKSRFKKW